LTARLVSAAVLAAVLAASAAACDGSSGAAKPAASRTSARKSASPAPRAGLTPDQIVQQALKNLAAASSVQITGGGLPSDGGSAAIDMTDSAPASCEGTIALSSTGASGSPVVAITKVDGTAYAKFNRSFLESVHMPAWEVTEVSGKYIESKSSSVIANLSGLCNVSTLVNDFIQGGDTGFVEAGAVTVEGQPAIALTQPNSTDGDTVYVSDSATPEILSFQQSAGPGTFLDFADFSAPVTITAPPSADIFHGTTTID
jgi:hypothetical protein